REVRGLDPPEHDVGVGDGERTAATVGRGPRISAGRVRTDTVPAAVEVQDRTAAGGDRVDAHHGGPHPYPGDGRLELPPELATVVGDVGRGTSHVEADDPVEAGGGGGTRHADPPAPQP